jgi:NTE family protein
MAKTVDKRGESRLDARADIDGYGQVVLVLQGGGALGAYQFGVYEALHEAGIEPAWVIGTSIGAINGAIIAGNPPERRLWRLTQFWEMVQGERNGASVAGWPAFGSSVTSALANATTVARGVAGFFSPNPQAAWTLQTPVGVEKAAFYLTTPLHETLAELVDFDYIKARHGRLTLGAVKVTSGEMHYFDNHRETLDVEHVLASGALPPAFPAVRIAGDAYWDGGLYSNTPLEVVLDDKPRRDSLIFTANVWQPKGPEPDSIWQVLGRQKEIQYASRADAHIKRQQQIHRLRHIIRKLEQQMPAAQCNEPAVRRLLDYGCNTVMHVVPLLAPRLDGEDHTKDIDFTPAGIAARRAAGRADMRRTLAEAPWRHTTDTTDGVIIHEAR